MSRRCALLAICLVTCSFGGFAFGQQIGRSALPSEATLGRLGLQRAWWAQATLDYGRDTLQFFTGDEQVTIVQADSGMVTVIDNATGHRRWAIQVGSPTEVRYAATTNDRVVVVVSGTTMYALDKKTGSLLAQVTVPSAPSCAPAMDDTQVYIGGINGNVYAFSTKILQELTKSNDLSKYGYRVLRRQFHSGGRIRYSPVATGTVVHVASIDGSLYGLFAKDFSMLYQFETNQPISAPLAYSGKNLIAATGDMKLYCLNSETGALRWEMLTGLNVRKAPCVIGDHVFLLSEGGGLRCLTTAAGKEVWLNRQADGFIAATPEIVYASSGTVTILVLNRADGRQIGSFSLPGFPIRIANDRTDRLYLASPRGLVLCIRERDREFPLLHKVPEKRPVLPDVAPDDEGQKPGGAAKKPAKPEKKEGDAEAGAEEKKEAADAAPATDAKPAAAPGKKPATAPPKKGDSE